MFVKTNGFDIAKFSIFLKFKYFVVMKFRF